MEMIGKFPKIVVLFLIYLYAIFFVATIIISIIHQIVLRNRRVGNPRLYMDDYLYKIYINGTSWLSLRSTSEVWISLQSSKGSSDFFILPSKHVVHDNVTDESVLSFSLETKECLGELQHMVLLVREKGYCAWQVGTIIVEDVQEEVSFEFNFFCSLEISYKTRMYIATSNKPFLPTCVLHCMRALPKYHNWIAAFARFNSVLEVSNSMHFILVFVVLLQSFTLGLLKEITEPQNAQMFQLRMDTFVILYLYTTTLIPDIIIHAAKHRNRFNKNVWYYEAVPKSKILRPKPKPNSSSEWLESLERLNLEQSEEPEGSEDLEEDLASREIDLAEGDVISVDSLELETLTQQRFSAISSHYTLTAADIAANIAADIAADTVEDNSDTMSWMSFYDQESPFFTISNLEKYTQYTTLFQPFKPRQLVRNRISLWIHFLQKWHKVQLRAVRTYRLLYAFWWRWQVLDVDMSFLQQEMNKLQVLVLHFQNTGQKIRDMSVWMEPHPLWQTAIERPKDEALVAPYGRFAEQLEKTAVHVMSNFLDHYNTIQRHRMLSRDIEWFIEDWFRELLDVILASGYLIKSETASESSDDSRYWLPPPLSARQAFGTGNVIRVAPAFSRRPSFDDPYNAPSADMHVAQIWYSWLPLLIREIGDHIIEAMEKRNLGLSLVDSITYVQMQHDGCLWESACVKIMGIMVDVILRDIVACMCVFLPEPTRRVMLQRSRSFLADCLMESAKPWSTFVESSYDLGEAQHRYTLVTILKGCVARCRAAPPSTHDLSADDAVVRANKMRLLFLLPDELKIADLPSDNLMWRMNTIFVDVIGRMDRLKSCVGAIRSQFDSSLTKQAAIKERVRKAAIGVVVNTQLTLCRLEKAMAHVELCRDAIDLDIPIAAMSGNYNRINFRQVFRTLASHYGQSRLGKRSVHRSTVRRASTRVHHAGTIMLERRPKDFDADVIQLLAHPWIPPLNYMWGLFAWLFVMVEVVALPGLVLHLSTRLLESSLASVFIIMCVGALMDLAFIQPLKCFLILLWQRYWETKGVHYVYQHSPFTC